MPDPSGRTRRSSLAMGTFQPLRRGGLRARRRFAATGAEGGLLEQLADDPKGDRRDRSGEGDGPGAVHGLPQVRGAGLILLCRFGGCLAVGGTLAGRRHRVLTGCRDVLDEAETSLWKGLIRPDRALKRPRRRAAEQVQKVLE